MTFVRNYWFIIWVIALFAVSQVALFTERTKVFLAAFALLAASGLLVLWKQ